MTAFSIAVVLPPVNQPLLQENIYVLVTPDKNKHKQLRVLMFKHYVL